MRQPDSPLWGRWRNDPVKLPLGWVTIEPDWWLTTTDGTNPDVVGDDPPATTERRAYPVLTANGSNLTGPYRWFQRADNDQTELLVPGVRSVAWDRSVESVAGTCQIVLSNQMIDPNGVISGRERQPFGNKGALTPHRGGVPYIPKPGIALNSAARWSAGQLVATALWGHERNEWFNELVPNALFRTYEGYADPANPNPSFDEARDSGAVVLTGVWLADKPEFPSSGVITIPCRDMTKLLIDQTLYKPLIPADRYPLRFAYTKTSSTLTTSTTQVLIDPGTAGAGFDMPSLTTNRRAKRALTYSASSSDIREGALNANVVAGGVAHRPTHANDNVSSSYWLSEGWQGPSMPYGVPWIEFNVGGQSVSAVELETWGSGYVVYVSVKVNGVWQGKRKVPYSGALEGHSYGAGIKFVVSKKFGPRTNSANATAKGIITLGQTFSSVEAVRISFRNLHKSPWGDLLKWRAGLRQLKVLGPGSALSLSEWVAPTYAEQVNYNVVTTTGPGNYSDYSEIIKQLLLWSGFYLLPPRNGLPYNQTAGEPQVYGNIESTGAYAQEPLPADMFDKRPVIDAINTIKQIVGYYFWVDEEGAARFQCADDQTQILTRRGWLNHDHLEVGDEALSLNRDTGLSEWKPVTKVNRHQVVDQTMVSIEGQGHSSLTTPNHRWWIPEQRRGRSARWVRSDSFTSPDRIPRAADRGDAPIEARYSDEMVELVAWWMNEGTWRGAGNMPGRSGSICQDSVVNGPYVERITRLFEKLYGPGGPRRRGIRKTSEVLDLAEDMIQQGARTFEIAAATGLDRHTVARWKADGVFHGAEWRITEAGSRRHWKFGAKAAADLWALAPDRIPTMDFLLALTQQQAAMFVATCIDGDGNYDTVKGRYCHRRWTQKDPRSVAAFEVACVLAGLTPSTKLERRDIHRVGVLTVPTYTPANHARKGITEQTYTGVVWCPTVADNETWLARRHGTVYFTGNSPNWWRPGNFDEFGNPVDFMPELDEQRTLLDYKPVLDGSSARSEIVVASEDPDSGLGGTITRLADPVGKDLLRGMVVPAMWVNKTFLKQSEQQRMVELLALHIFMSLRQGQATILANPLLSPDDQVRILERVGAESAIHYVRGLSSSHDFVTGDYTMNVTTAWLGDRENWAIRRSDGPSPSQPPIPYRYYTCDAGETWDRIIVRLKDRYKETFSITRIQQLNAAALEETDGELVQGLRLVIG